MAFFKSLALSGAALAGVAAGTIGAQAQTPAAAPVTASAAANDPTYADLATLSDASDAVVHVRIRKATALKPERAPGVAPGFVRFYVEANTLSVIAGRSAVAPTVTYLVDMPLDARGKAPKLKKREFLLFARPVPSRPGELQLVAPAAQLAYSPMLEERVRPVLTELYAADVKPRIIGVSDALAVPGTLTGESETQIFLATEKRSPASITVLRRPGRAPEWGVSWGGNHRFFGPPAGARHAGMVQAGLRIARTAAHQRQPFARFRGAASGGERLCLRASGDRHLRTADHRALTGHGAGYFPRLTARLRRLSAGLPFQGRPA